MAGHSHANEPDYSLRAFGRFWWKAAPVLLLLSVATLAAEMLGWLEPIQRASLDAFLRSERPMNAKDIFIVAITDEDYKTYFSEASPLDPCTVMRLVRKVAAARPAVVAIDLDTSSKDYATVSCPPDNQRLEIPQTAGAKLIWALVPDAVEKPVKGRLRFTDPRVVGREFSDALDVGIPTFAAEGDGLVRKYAGEFKTDLTTGTSVKRSEVESLPRAIAKAYAEAKHDNPPASEEGIIRFTGQASPFHVIQADDFLHDTSDPAFGKPDFSPLTGKIVLIGGMYHAARDRYPTPVGTMAGVELIAHAVQSDLMGGGIRESGKVIALGVDLLAGTIIIAMYFRWEHEHFRWAFWGSMAAIPVLSIAGSAIAFNTKAYWIDFAPVIVGMVGHQLYEAANKYHDKEHELHEALARIKVLESQLNSRAETAKPS